MRSPLRAPARQNNRQQDETRTAANGGKDTEASEIIDILSWNRVGLRRKAEREREQELPPPPKEKKYIYIYLIKTRGRSDFT